MTDNGSPATESENVRKDIAYSPASETETEPELEVAAEAKLTEKLIEREARGNRGE